MARHGGVIAMTLRRWVMPTAPAGGPWMERGVTSNVVKRGFAQERPEDSSTSNWGTGEPPIDQKATQRGVAPGSKESQQQKDTRGPVNTDSEGQVHTPNLTRQKTTRDFINTKREERMNAAKDSKPVSEVDPEGAEKQEEIKKHGASPADLAAS